MNTITAGASRSTPAELVLENQVVVHYGDQQDMVLLGAHDRSGTDLALDRVAAHWQRIGSVVGTWPAMSLADFLKWPTRCPTAPRSPDRARRASSCASASGVRAKAKLSEYTRLHKTLKSIGPQRV
ncbi:hypothetical protein [Streptomyces mutabilis]|uniref:Uncharacterized protein n=1 Tax=Streptomyces mutabilis TaxID=67332 RepID=A0A086MRB0_9ACTN|nr:hypothetical protein [Streptomyces mutabilis]KFG71428.1 hypothetical protein FM21_34685 [Streptomyces mutabilis]